MIQFLELGVYDLRIEILILDGFARTKPIEVVYYQATCQTRRTHTGNTDQDALPQTYCQRFTSTRYMARVRVCSTVRRTLQTHHLTFLTTGALYYYDPVCVSRLHPSHIYAYAKVYTQTCVSPPQTHTHHTHHLPYVPPLKDRAHTQTHTHLHTHTHTCTLIHTLAHAQAPAYTHKLDTCRVAAVDLLDVSCLSLAARLAETCDFDRGTRQARLRCRVLSTCL